MTLIRTEIRSPAPAHERPTQATLAIVAWHDPVVEPAGHDPRAWYVEHFWLPVLGPTCIWLLRRLAAGLDATGAAKPGASFTLSVPDTARALGLGGRQGRNSPLWRAIDRSVAFEMARWQGQGVLAVRRALPPLAQRYLVRLPASLQRMHDAWVHASRPGPALDDHRRRARRLALGLTELGESDDAVELQLVRWGIHPAVAHESTKWARSLPEPSTRAATLPEAVSSSS
ncbi:MAG: hypothetical protein ACYDA2_03550 [Acidimicrobiales bacterium]